MHAKLCYQLVVLGDHVLSSAEQQGQLALGSVVLKQKQRLHKAGVGHLQNVKDALVLFWNHGHVCRCVQAFFALTILKMLIKLVL